MAPHYTEATVEGRSYGFTRILKELGLHATLYSTNYLVPEEIGSLPENTSVITIEPRVKHDAFDQSAGCFMTHYKPEVEQFECVPFFLSKNGRELQAPAIGLRLLFSYSNQESSKLGTLEVNNDFGGILDRGFREVRFWDAGNQRYAGLKAGDSLNFEETLVMVPEFSRGTTFILPLSEISSGGRGLEELKKQLTNL